MEKIESIKGIPACRQQMRLASKKLIPKAREIWPLRRHGILSGHKIFVEPTRPGIWTWYPVEYYKENLILQVIEVLAQVNTDMSIDEMEKKVQCPPCIDTSLRTVLRQYPHRIRLRMDVGNSILWVSVIKEVKLPSYENVSISLGRFVPFEPQEFDWEDHADNDSIQPLQSDLVIPDVFYDLCITQSYHLPATSECDNSNPFFVVYWNKKYMYHTSVKHKTRSPVWNDTRVKLPVPFESDIGLNVLRIECWNYHCQKQIISLTQELELTGQILSNFLDPIKHTTNPFMTFPLESHFEVLSRAATTMTNEVLNDAENAVMSAGDKEDPVVVTERVNVGDGSVNAKGDDDGNILKEGDEEGDAATDEALKRNMSLEKDVEVVAITPARIVAVNNKKNETERVEPATTEEELVIHKTATHGQVQLLGAKSYFQLKVTHVQELFSRDYGDSEDINPIAIISWNGLDIGQTSICRNTRWATWNDAVFNIPVPANMEIYACLLVIDVYHMHNIGGKKDLLSTISVTGRLLKDLLTKSSPYCGYGVFDLRLPMNEEERLAEAAAANSGARNNNKHKVSGGKVSIIGGLVGLQEKDEKYFEVTIKVASGMARAEVLCKLYWNGRMIGVTDVAKSVTEGKSVKWYWRQGRFVFSIPMSENITKVSELKVDCYDPSVKGTNSYIGCVIVTGKDLADMVDGPYAVMSSQTLKKDPNKDEKLQKISKGTLQLRCGNFGARLENERAIEVVGGVNISTSSSSSLSPSESNHVLENCYCIVSWNNTEIGRTKSILNDGYPIWGAFDNKWCYGSNIHGPGQVYTNSTLTFEIFVGNCDEHSTNSISLGVAEVHGMAIQDFLERAEPLTMELKLEAPRSLLPKIEGKKQKRSWFRKSKKVDEVELQSNEKITVQGCIVIGTPGMSAKSPLHTIKAEEDKLQNSLNSLLSKLGQDKYFDEHLNGTSKLEEEKKVPAWELLSDEELDDDIEPKTTQGFQHEADGGDSISKGTVNDMAADNLHEENAREFFVSENDAIVSTLTNGDVNVPLSEGVFETKADA